MDAHREFYSLRKHVAISWGETFFSWTIIKRDVASRCSLERILNVDNLLAGKKEAFSLLSINQNYFFSVPLNAFFLRWKIYAGKREKKVLNLWKFSIVFVNFLCNEKRKLRHINFTYTFYAANIFYGLPGAFNLLYDALHSSSCTSLRRWVKPRTMTSQSRPVSDTQLKGRAKAPEQEKL